MLRDQGESQDCVRYKTIVEIIKQRKFERNLN